MAQKPLQLPTWLQFVVDRGRSQLVAPESLTKYTLPEDSSACSIQPGGRAFVVAAVVVERRRWVVVARGFELGLKLCEDRMKCSLRRRSCCTSSAHVSAEATSASATLSVRPLIPAKVDPRARTAAGILVSFRTKDEFRRDTEAVEPARDWRGVAPSRAAPRATLPAALSSSSPGWGASEPSLTSPP